MKLILFKEFEVNDFEKVKNYLGIEFSRNENKIHLYQSGYITELLKYFGMTDVNSESTSMDPNVKLMKHSKETMKEEKQPYHELTDFTHLASATRSDICSALSFQLSWLI